jgi:NAD-dependent DNA ligase
MEKIKIPTHCPACDSELKITNGQLFCINENCTAKSRKNIEHFAKQLKIKGLGPKTIEELDIYSIPRLYEISKEEIIHIIGTALGSKLYEEIEKSKSAELKDILIALSVPGLGPATATKLCEVISSIDDISKDTCEEASLGPVVTKSILENIVNKLDRIKQLPFNFSIQKKTQNSTTCKGYVCISGHINGYKSKVEVTNLLNEKGYTVVPSVTSKTTIILNEDGNSSSKVLEAKKRNIPILTLKDILNRENK